MPTDFEAYLRALATTPLDEKTEHTDRGALETLLRASADDAGPGATVQHEPRRDRGGGGSPDYKVSRKGRIAGYVEVKQIDENLSKVLKSDQIKKYQTLSDNIVLTDYLEFCWIKPDGPPVRARLAHSEDFSGKRLRLKPDAVDAVRLLLRGFFSTTPGHTGRAQDLALALAHRARLLRDFLTTELVRQEKVHREGRLHALYDVFRQQVFHELKVVEFADAFAQMLAYGLFLARLNAGANETVTLENVRRFIPGSFSLIRELVRFLEEMNEKEYVDIIWVVDEVLSLVNGLDLAAIHQDLSFRSRKAISRKVRAGDEEEHRLFERDPFIYFYEDFLKAYDPAMRKGRGVYYTPPPVVNFIVRAVDDILKSSFGIPDGLADHNKVTVLDFACGTGTFLLEVFERIFDNIGGSDAGRADAVVREHITKNLFGFEYLIAPYTIAHLKLSQYLKDKGHPLHGNERLQVFLTNTLEPVEPQPNFFLPALAAEVSAAQGVKDRNILVIVGNPPYSGFSKNMGNAAQQLIQPYRWIDGQPLGEKKNWLQDDYVKFLAFAQRKMETVDRGIVGVITNHNYLDGPTFRGMRQQLMKTFDQISIIDLHGSLQRIEPVPDGVRDENVFDIKPGVAVVLFIKGSGPERSVRHAELYGTRLDKYKTLAAATIKDTEWTPLTPHSPYYFMNKNQSASEDEDGVKITDLFRVSSTALQTSRDGLAVAISREELDRRLGKLVDKDNSDIDFHPLLRKRRAGPFLPGDSNFWTLGEARQQLRRKTKVDIVDLAYRPFDNRFVIYDDAVIHRLKSEVSDQMLLPNIALLVPRQLSSPDFRHALVTDEVPEMCTISSATKEQNRVFPLYTYSEARQASNFSNKASDFVFGRYENHYTPEEILGYIYAILYTPTYRSCYAEFLRIDFPRIPFPEEAADFEALSALGWALVQAHLLREVPSRKLADFHGKGDRTVDAVRYAPAEQAVWINKSQSFAPVPQAVWDFHIGGYQVLDKYLKSRKGRVLSLDEITHLAKVADSLALTIDQMALIDAAYLKAFPQPKPH